MVKTGLELNLRSKFWFWKNEKSGFWMSKNEVKFMIILEMVDAKMSPKVVFTTVLYSQKKL